MIWLSWRLQRTETLIAGAVLAALAALLVPTGIQMASAYHHDGLAACLTAQPSFACGSAVDSFTSRFESLRQVTDWLTLIPGLIGVTLAASVILDLERGTHRLAWTQSITRRRWLAGRLGVAIGAALLATLALTLLLTWWRGPWVHLQGRVEPSAYDSEGIVLYGYTLFALGLALAIGVVWRRAVPALVIAFVSYFAVRLFVDTWLRQRLVAPVTTTWNGRANGPNLNHAWVLTEAPSDRFGHVTQHISPCGGPNAAPAKALSCLSQQGLGYMHAVYHPASHFWPLQSIETALFAGTALLMIGFAAWWTRERVA